MKDGTNVQVRASHVFIAIPEGADAQVVADKQAQAQKVLERAKAGEDFAKLAKESSDDAATRAEGGDLGFFGKDMLPKPIEEIVFAMKVGDIRGPIRADRGFHVIKLVDRKLKDPKAVRRGHRLTTSGCSSARRTWSGRPRVTWPNCARRPWSTFGTETVPFTEQRRARD